MDITNTANVYNLEDDEFLTPLLGGSTGFSEQAGVIRPGIMVLKKDAAANEASKSLYKKLYKEGKRFDQIDKALGVGPDDKSQLTPKNVDYFTVRPDDCVNPDHAKKIMEYADEDGKLRSLPVWFPVNEWWELIPHSLKCYGQSAGLRHRSNFIAVRENGRVTDMKMVCESPEPCVPGRKIFGGRSWTQKECDPQTCELYQSGECKLRGSIQCMIPGIPGIGTWSIPTTSFYSLNSIKNTLRKVYTATHGRIANIKDQNNKTIFLLRKRLTTIPTIDVKTGQPKLREQYLITLEVTIDLWNLSDSYGRDRVLTRGEQAAALLSDNAKVVYLNKDTAGQPVTASEQTATQIEKGDDNPQPQDLTETEPAQKVNPAASTDKSLPVEDTPKQDASSKDKAVSPSQLDCIRKLTARYEIPADLVDKELKDVKTFSFAAAVIKELNKGDISRFLPR